MYFYICLQGILAITPVTMNTTRSLFSMYRVLIWNLDLPIGWTIKVYLSASISNFWWFCIMDLIWLLATYRCSKTSEFFYLLPCKHILDTYALDHFFYKFICQCSCCTTQMEKYVYVLSLFLYNYLSFGLIWVPSLLEKKLWV